MSQSGFLKILNIHARFSCRQPQFKHITSRGIVHFAKVNECFQKPFLRSYKVQNLDNKSRTVEVLGQLGIG